MSNYVYTKLYFKLFGKAIKMISKAYFYLIKEKLRLMSEKDWNEVHNLIKEGETYFAVMEQIRPKLDVETEEAKQYLKTRFKRN